MTLSEAIHRSQVALFEQGGNEDVITYLDQLRIAVGYISDAKLYVDRINSTVNPEN